MQGAIVQIRGLKNPQFTKFNGSIAKVTVVFADEGKVGVELLDSGQTPPPTMKLRTESAPTDMLPIGSAIITSSGALADSGITAIVHAASGSIIQLARAHGHVSVAVPFIGGQIFLQRIGTTSEILAGTIVQAAILSCNGLNVSSTNPSSNVAQKVTLSTRLITFLPEDTRLFNSIVAQFLRAQALPPGSSVSVLQGDICAFSLHGCSAIVNAANTEVQFGAGVSGAIGRATGCSKTIDCEAKNVIKKFNAMHVATAEGMAQTSASLVASNPASVLFIPASLHTPISSVMIPYDDDDSSAGSVGCVTKYANSHFSGVGGGLSPEAQANWTAGVVQQLVAKGHDEASALAMARRMSPGDMQVSDIVTMLPACDKTCWVGVSMHCDDYGVARGLPSNPRASEIAKKIGLNLDVKGDVFISRFYDNNDDFKRLNMGQGDLSSTSKWFEVARQIMANRPQQ